jgi:hypothetical protein
MVMVFQVTQLMHNYIFDAMHRHILKDGQACLEVPTEIKRRWPQGPNSVDFLVNWVDPF